MIPIIVIITRLIIVIDIILIIVITININIRINISIGACIDDFLWSSHCPFKSAFVLWYAVLSCDPFYGIRDADPYLLA